MSTQKTVLITGCTSGIGKATARRLAREGHNVITLNRPGPRAHAAYQELEGLGTGTKRLYTADLSDGQAVLDVAAEISRDIPTLDVLINNAGLIRTKESFSTDGLELTVAVNVRAPLILTRAMLPLLGTSGNGRVLFLSSELYKKARLDPTAPLVMKKFNGSTAYANSKMLMTLLAETLAESYPDISFFSVHPGVIGTDVFKDYPRFFTTVMKKLLPSPEKAAELLYSLALSELQAANGSYFMEARNEPVVQIPQSEQIKAVLLNWFQTGELPETG